MAFMLSNYNYFSDRTIVDISNVYVRAKFEVKLFSLLYQIYHNVYAWYTMQTFEDR